MEGFGRDVDAAGQRIGAAGERFGQQAEAAGKRLAADPSVVRVVDTTTRVWGGILLALGLWFLADVTLALDMPGVPWGDLWPFALILVGLVVVARGMGRRTA